MEITEYVPDKKREQVGKTVTRGKTEVKGDVTPEDVEKTQRLSIKFKLTNGTVIPGSGKISLKDLKGVIESAIKTNEMLGIGQTYLINPTHIVCVEVSPIKE